MRPATRHVKHDGSGKSFAILKSSVHGVKISDVLFVFSSLL